MLKQHCLSMARYHGWAHERLLGALAGIDDADYRADRGLFFRSLHGTLNHLLLADLIWYGRFTGRPHAARTLADEVEPDRSALAARVMAQCALWQALAADADDTLLGSRLRYTNMAGAPCDTQWATTLLHVFNHGTHHRGQMSAAITQLGGPAAEMDFIYFARLDT